MLLLPVPLISPSTRTSATPHCPRSQPHNMSSAHRPTWAPAQGKEGRQNSRSFSARDLASHTRLKFRQVRPDVLPCLAPEPS